MATGAFVETAVEPEKARAARMLRQRAIIHAARHGLPRPPLPEHEPYVGFVEAESEKERAARMLRQRAIIKAWFQAKRAASQPVPLPTRERKDLAKAA